MTFLGVWHDFSWHVAHQPATASIACGGCVAAPPIKAMGMDCHGNARHVADELAAEVYGLALPLQNLTTRGRWSLVPPGW